MRVGVGLGGVRGGNNGLVLLKLRSCNVCNLENALDPTLLQHHVP